MVVVGGRGAVGVEVVGGLREGGLGLRVVGCVGGAVGGCQLTVLGGGVVGWVVGGLLLGCWGVVGWAVGVGHFGCGWWGCFGSVERCWIDVVWLE